MKANELRIGNLIKGLDNSTTYRVISVLEDRIVSKSLSYNITNTFYMDDSDIKPISLTEEWVVKFGFESNSTVFENYQVETFVIQEAELTIGFSSIGNIDVNFKEVPIKEPKYVHELQNLYFALTGEELTIKK